MVHYKLRINFSLLTFEETVLPVDHMDLQDGPTFVIIVAMFRVSKTHQAESPHYITDENGEVGRSSEPANQQLMRLALASPDKGSQGLLSRNQNTCTDVVEVLDYWYIG